jgi:RNA 3'-terminal phosphate cyclase-like protein
MPGLRDYEVSLLKLVDKLTNGSKIIINETGTSVTFSPGQLTGGKISHDCATTRSVVYYLEIAAGLAPFCKEPVVLQLRGSTHGEHDQSVDVFRSVTVPLLQKLGIPQKDETTALSFKIVSRSYGPTDNIGSVIFTCPIVKHLAPVDFPKEGLVNRIRGVFWSSHMNREFSTRFVEAARGILNRCVADVWVYTETVRNSSEPTMGASLMSETHLGFFKGISAISKDPNQAEKLGMQMAKKLMKEIASHGICDSSHQWLVCLFMALAQDHKVSSCVIGNELTENTIEFLRNIQKFLLVRFKIQRLEDEESTAEEEDDGETKKSSGPIRLECIGVNMTNTARKSL